MEKQKVGIVAVVYYEPEWVETEKQILACGVPVHFQDRKGVGSLAKAYNDGFRALMKRGDFEYVWFISNIHFDPNILPKLVESLDTTGYDCIHPTFESDHEFCRPDGSGEIKLVPFVEFTSPLVRTETFKKFPLDEHMPYWGHDFSWGMEVRKAGGNVSVHHGIQVDHIYIRFNVKQNGYNVTKHRHALRKSTNQSTKRRLRQLYGPGWSKLVRQL